MNISVIPTIQEARVEELRRKTVIVIDVLRATSTMLAALASGCRAVIPVETVEQAKELQLPGHLLGGERGCRRIPGFDLGNSPLEYTPSVVGGSVLVMTTTNGTRAIRKAEQAGRILAGSLLNARACAGKALALGREIVILCSGTRDIFSLEDGLGAGAIVDELLSAYTGSGRQGDHLQVNDFGLAMLHAFRAANGNLEGALLACENGRRLVSLGFREDVAYCSRLNAIEAAPEIADGRLQLFPTLTSL
ncbi:2-phosphosulfolactate phosphatase [Paenibacillus mucilaginosus]|uniref:Probable 2-phosphosulfolactate phosphatase n=3 Tax=Paenibacillus mucilaginosus TaxID=61624 RepID=H6NL67_9BACL|nr:2-phosphosulfolactate phosphatase [Paenibacillus mucilaginosus]AEI41221.1 2-phosphosulfolactate phosphatase [Paenibacillus mucilaginosus KNP414]AFC29774.1 2-phosphosulfolactate phosphatase [Paenibacillus mucilaginosus 3016]AFH61959.1 2-phosphosulfolactate phosphatase [Paenibacillus mucilaginosus K02]MCG7211356.1 2-phosphosulfolactate phosphatase [Paenibacillus mucilaginosus]WDM30260.1 2-phosphosulfolactate phosphatase [Paenibacillus mucilaginosus]